MSNPFFITGLPRSRTAWLANLLTERDSFCFHCLSREHGSVSDFVDAIEAKIASKSHNYVGNSEPGISTEMFDALNSRFPDARWAIVKRGVTDSFVAQSRAFPQLAPIFNESLLLHCQHELGEMETTLGGRCVTIGMEDLNDHANCYVLARHLVPNFLLPFDRWKLLNKLRVETIGEKALEEFAPDKKAFIERVICHS